MKNVFVITPTPEIITSVMQNSIVIKAKNNNLVDFEIINLRDYSDKKYKKVDDNPYGGGAGMVMLIEPIDKCISKLKSERDYDEIIYMTPDGSKLNQSLSNKLSCMTNIIILCGQYKGIDQRIRENLITMEILSNLKLLLI